MTRLAVGLVLGLLAVPAGSVAAQEGPPWATIKKVDAERGVVVLTVGKEDQEFHVGKWTRFADERKKDIADGLKDKRFKKGAAVIFFARQRDGKRFLLGLKLAGKEDESRRDRPGPGPQIRTGRIKKLDLEKKLLIVTAGGKDHEFTLSEDVRVLGASGKTLRERLKGFKEGAAIQFGVVKKGGKEVLMGLRLAGAGGGGPPGERINFDTSKLRPLTELGTGKYQGYEGGLYPGGKNDRPAAHEKAGLRLAGQVVPRDAGGKPKADGKIVLLSVGMSNTSQVSGGFEQQLEDAKGVNPRLVFVNGAQGGMTAQAIQDPDDEGRGTKYWTEVDRRLKKAGVTRAQVQVVWIKQADAGPTEGFPGYARQLQGELRRIVQVLAKRFPNVKLVYLSSRTFGGYARSRLNPEPYAYESGFAVRWLIEEQIKGDKAVNFDPDRGAVKAPWLSWGPYLWANGTAKRADGFSYSEDDFARDGTHLSASGVRKTGKLLLDFFQSDSTTKPWFLAP
jgi:hypothetical protein